MLEFLSGSLAFMHYVLECRSAKLCIDSRRISGCATRLYLLKRKLKQQNPLLVSKVIGLEKICIGEIDASLEERVASGFSYIWFMQGYFCVRTLLSL